MNWSNSSNAAQPGGVRASSLRKTAGGFLNPSRKENEAWHLAGIPSSFKHKSGLVSVLQCCIS